VEFFLWLRHGEPAIGPDDIAAVVHGEAGPGAASEKVDL